MADFTLAQAISPTGRWGKVWLAAHWDKKLKKEDFLETNIPQIASSILENSEKLTLRYMGNFLLGMCKVYTRHCLYFEEHGRDLQDNLMLAFSSLETDKRKARTTGGAVTEAKAAAVDAASEADIVDEVLERVLASRRHLAPLEEITLKPVVEDALESDDRMHSDTFGAASANDKAALLALFKRTKRAFPSEALPLMLESDTLMPLVELAPEASVAAAGLDALGPLDMDIDGAGEDPNVDMRGPEALEDEQDALVGAGAGEEPLVKRRRRGFMFDDPAEISKETYQGYMNDRSAINKKHNHDSTILLPHNHPSMPQFMTTYTDMCNSLIQGLSWGSQVAERRRTVMAMAEAASGVPSVFPGMWSEALGSRPADVQSMTGSEIVVAQPPGFLEPVPMTDRWEPENITHLDLSDAPNHMGLVITGAADNEDQSANADARVGYSGRTEKMHKFLAQEFKRSDSNAQVDESTLSYEQLCRNQSGGDRGLIAGCFFELLVLRTNGVVNLRQETPYSDIRIEKSKSWGTTS